MKQGCFRVGGGGTYVQYTQMHQDHIVATCEMGFFVALPPDVLTFCQTAWLFCALSSTVQLRTQGKLQL